MEGIYSWWIPSTSVISVQSYHASSFASVDAPPKHLMQQQPNPMSFEGGNWILVMVQQHFELALIQPASGSMHSSAVDAFPSMQHTLMSEEMHGLGGAHPKPPRTQ